MINQTSESIGFIELTFKFDHDSPIEDQILKIVEEYKDVFNREHVINSTVSIHINFYKREK